MSSYFVYISVIGVLSSRLTRRNELGFVLFSYLRVFVIRVVLYPWVKLISLSLTASVGVCGFCSVSRFKHVIDVSDNSVELLYVKRLVVLSTTQAAYSITEYAIRLASCCKPWQRRNRWIRWRHCEFWRFS